MRESGGGSWAPRPTPPPRYGTLHESVPPAAGARAETTSVGGNLLPRSPVTTDREPSRPPPAGQRRATTAGGMRGPSEGLHEGPALGRGGRGKGATPQLMAGPRGRDCHAAPPPPAVRRRRQGTRGPPPLPPPLPLRPESGKGGGPPTPPPRTPPAEEPQARPSAPPEPGGRPPPRRDGDAVGGAAAAPPPASRHWRAGATRTTEQYGGRAPHDLPETTAHSGGAEGGFRSARAPGGAVRGPPLTPPIPGRHFNPDRRRTPEGSALATRRGPGLSTAGRRPEGEQGGHGATPPPPPPHRPASRGGPGPHPPRQGG